jgi:hypothetical protein
MRRFSRYWVFVTAPITFLLGWQLSRMGVPSLLFAGVAMAVTVGAALSIYRGQRRFRQQIEQMAVEAAEEMKRRDRSDGV